MAINPVTPSKIIIGTQVTLQKAYNACYPVFQKALRHLHQAFLATGCFLKKAITVLKLASYDLCSRIYIFCVCSFSKKTQIPKIVETTVKAAIESNQDISAHWFKYGNIELKSQARWFVSAMRAGNTKLAKTLLMNYELFGTNSHKNLCVLLGALEEDYNAGFEFDGRRNEYHMSAEKFKEIISLILSTHRLSIPDLETLFLSLPAKTDHSVRVFILENGSFTQDFLYSRLDRVLGLVEHQKDFPTLIYPQKLISMVTLSNEQIRLQISNLSLLAGWEGRNTAQFLGYYLDRDIEVEGPGIDPAGNYAKCIAYLLIKAKDQDLLKDVYTPEALKSLVQFVCLRLILVNDQETFISLITKLEMNKEFLTTLLDATPAAYKAVASEFISGTIIPDIALHRRAHILTIQ